MEAIILVGGLGSRLGPLTENTPKPMLPIREVPFLDRMLQNLYENHISKVILAVGYKKEVVETYFSKTRNNIPKLKYSIESSPLGTGGAILKSLSQVEVEHVFVLNGDSYLDVDFDAMYSHHKSLDSDITIASHYIFNADRYGVLQANEATEVVSFEEKGLHTEGLINGGVYLVKVSSMRSLHDVFEGNRFSFEEKILSINNQDLKIVHFRTNGAFLDIGVPEDYKRAQKELF